MTSIQRARGDIAALRDELTDDLRALGPNAARLEAIDATLRSATEAGIARVWERLAAAMEASFSRAMRAALRDLPAATSVAAVEPWFAERGAFGAQLARTRDVTFGLLAREGAILEALVDAACRRGDA